MYGPIYRLCYLRFTVSFLLNAMLYVLLILMQVETMYMQAMLTPQTPCYAIVMS
jgi:uncharacterized metal-binding protein